MFDCWCRRWSNGNLDHKIKDSASGVNGVVGWENVSIHSFWDEGARDGGSMDRDRRDSIHRYWSRPFQWPAEHSCNMSTKIHHARDILLTGNILWWYVSGGEGLIYSGGNDVLSSGRQITEKRAQNRDRWGGPWLCWSYVDWRDSKYNI